MFFFILMCSMSGDVPPIADFRGKSLNEKDVQNRVQQLRNLALGDNKLNQFRTDDAYLLRFLHCTDFDVSAAFKRMQDFCNLLLEHPDWFGSTPPLENKAQIDKKVKVMLRDRDKSGRRIYVVKLGKVDASSSSPQEQTRIDEIWFESVMDEPMTQANGISVILDMSEYSWKLFRWLTPGNLRIASAKADLYPCKQIVYHIVNTSFLVNASVKLAWPFLSNKIKELIKFHFENWPSLHEYINPEVLPSEYGGTGPEIDFDKLNQWLFDQDSEIGKRLKYQKIVAT